MVDDWDWSAATWFVRVGEQVRGPVTLDQLDRALHSGKIPTDAMVAREGEEAWRSVILVLAAAVAAIPREQAAREAMSSWVQEPEPEDDKTRVAASALERSDGAGPGVGFLRMPAQAAQPATQVESARLPVSAPQPSAHSAPRTASGSVGREPVAPGGAIGAVPARSEVTARQPRLWGGSARKRAAVAGAAVVLAGLVALGVVRLRSSLSKRRSLPVVAQKLPPRTLRVAEARLRSDLEEVAVLPDAYLASSLAEAACGGADVATLLAGARSRDLPGLKRDGILDMANNARWRDALSCGEAVRKTLASPAVVTVLFSEGESVALVRVVRSSMTDLPMQGAYVRHTFSGLPGFCVRQAGDKGDCTEGAHAGFRDGTTWVFGAVGHVEAFARAYTTAREELTTTVEILRDTVEQSAPADVTVIQAKPESIPWAQICERAAPSGSSKDFHGACFPSGQGRLLESVASKVRGLAVQHDLLATSAGIHSSYVLVTRDDDAAREVEKDLLDLVRDWRAQLANREADLVRMVRAPSSLPHDRLIEAAFDAYLRAMKAMRVERSGSVVRVVLREPFRPAEAKAIKEFVETRSQDELATVKVVEAMIQKSPLPEKSLALLVGPEVATWIVAPRATAADCDAILQRVRSSSGAQPSPEDVALKSDLEQRFVPAACVGTVLTADAKACFQGAQTLQAFGACKLPVSPFAHALTRRLVGQWEVEGVKASRASAGFRQVLGATKLEISEDRIAMQWGETQRLDGRLEVRASDLDHAVLARDGVAWKVVELQKDHLVMPGFADGVEEVSFKRAKLPRSLFDAPKSGAK